MVTVKVQVFVLPLASVTTLVTLVTPTGNVLPLGGVLTTLATPQLSVALTLKVTLLRLQRPASALNTRLVGHVITGLSWSVMEPVKVHLLVFPPPSVAVPVTTVTPTGKVLPLGGEATILLSPQFT